MVFWPEARTPFFLTSSSHRISWPPGSKSKILQQRVKPPRKRRSSSGAELTLQVKKQAALKEAKALAVTLGVPIVKAI